MPGVVTRRLSVSGVVLNMVLFDLCQFLVKHVY
jgi:hypothetical protein